MVTTNLPKTQVSAPSEELEGADCRVNTQHIHAGSTPGLDARIDACSDFARPQAALPVCDRLLEDGALTNDARAFVHYSRGIIAMDRQDMAGALPDLDEAVRLEPSQSAFHAARGIAHGTLGDLGSAIGDFSRAIELKPDDAVSFQNRGKAYADVGEQRLALMDFSSAIDLGNDQGDTRNGRCWARAVLNEELELALEDCRTAVRMASQVANNLNSLAFVRFRGGDYAGAIDDYTAALAIDPAVASSYYMRGRAKQAINDPTAADDVARGMRLEPGVAQRYAGYGIAP